MLRAPGARTEWLPAGAFRPERSDGGVVLLLDGLVARTVVIAGAEAAELLLPGDVLAPTGSRGVAAHRVRFEALGTIRVAALDPAAIAADPAWAAALLAGAGRRSAERAALHAITRITGVDRRLLALFRLLGARLGRPTRDGVAVPLAAPHRLLAELVGARRPTVTTALRELRRRGDLRRLPDGTWLVRPE